jgi:hypothetical protein
LLGVITSHLKGIERADHSETRVQSEGSECLRVKTIREEKANRVDNDENGIEQDDEACQGYAIVGSGSETD